MFAYPLLFGRITNWPRFELKSLLLRSEGTNHSANIALTMICYNYIKSLSEVQHFLLFRFSVTRK